jgi:16S rRNA (uracil1498-N3)-methyltransferase
LKGKAFRHHRFYCPPESIARDLVHFPEDESVHITASLRLGVGDIVTATDGAGRIYEIRLEEASGREVVGKILKVTSVAPARRSVWVFQGIVRPARMDLVIEKCVELGVAGFVAVRGERSVRRVADSRPERWKRIAIEAIKQSLQAYLPEMSAPQTFGAALEAARRLDMILVASEEGGASLAQVLKYRKPDRIGLWVGPEGGFAHDEAEALRAAGAVTFSLGASRLRSETATLASLALIHGLFSD